jgi:flagellar biosynthesis protein FliR
MTWILDQWMGYGLVFARMAGAFVFFPGWNRVPPRTRTLWALTLSVVLAPILVPTSPPSRGWLFVQHIITEGMIGSFAALLGHILMGSVDFFGHFFGMQGGLSNAFSQSTISHEQGALSATFFMTFFITFLWVHDWHHLLISMMIRSYEIFPPGTVHQNWGDFSPLAINLMSSAFLLALQMCGPVIIFSLFLMLIAGLMNRLAPSLPVFFMLPPIQMMVAFVILWFGLAPIISHVSHVFLKSTTGFWTL